MSFPKINPTQTKAWQHLQDHFTQVKDRHMLDLFKEHEERAEEFSIQWEEFYLDYSKNRITPETKRLLMQLADQVGLKAAIKAQFSGDVINETEDRAVGHTALRDFSNLQPEIAGSLRQMKQFSEEIIAGNHKGYTGKPITHIVNIGIGGSHLGPSMMVDALEYYRNHLKVHYISNVDGDHVQQILKDVPAETTLFIVVSKTFTTQETITNAHVARNWFLENATEADIAQHFVAVSTNQDAVLKFGIDSNNVFPLWNWVGGRFSLWSTVGLSTCCAIGYDHFERLLKGAHQMDQHFQNTAFDKNIPVIMGMLSVWYNNFFNIETEAVLPYSEYLRSFVDHLQQMIMESNGKSVDRNGNDVSYQTGTIVWGSTGTNAQHAFFQLIHQGTKLIPADFICFKKSLHDVKDQHQKLLANCLAQTDALLAGTKKAKMSMPYKKFDGNKPTNTLLIDSLTPETAGALAALYEHKMFVQGVVWNIFSYDQWGVELGKKVAIDTLHALKEGTVNDTFNSSTAQLLMKLNNE